MRRGDGTDVQPAPDAIAPARDEPIRQIEDWLWNPSERYRDCRPGARQFAQHRQYRPRSNQNALACPTGILHHDNGLGGRRSAGGRHPVPSQQRGNFRRIGRHKPHSVVPVVGQEPPHRAVAQSATAVEDDKQPPTEFKLIRHPLSGFPPALPGRRNARGRDYFFFAFARSASSFLRSRMSLVRSFSGMARTALVRLGSFS